MKTMTFLLAYGLAQIVYADTTPPAYQRAAKSAGIPSAVLYAIARVESNKKIKIGYHPWPWTLNIAGQSLYFSTRKEACIAIVHGLAAHGKYKVDIGLTQLNWGWVGEQHFSHPCAALSPSNNLMIAAKQLRRCFEIEQDWIKAAGCYHRPAGGEPAARYRERFASRYVTIQN